MNAQRSLEVKLHFWQGDKSRRLGVRSTCKCPSCQDGGPAGHISGSDAEGNGFTVTLPFEADVLQMRKIWESIDILPEDSRRERKVAVPGVNADGETDFFFVRVRATDSDVEQGMHTGAAQFYAKAQGFEPANVVYDETDPPWNHLAGMFVWESASVIGTDGKEWIDATNHEAREEALWEVIGRLLKYPQDSEGDTVLYSVRDPDGNYCGPNKDLAALQELYNLRRSCAQSLPAAEKSST